MTAFSRDAWLAGTNRFNGATLPSLGAVRIFYSAHALAETSERLFPHSKHRSRRIHKKLVKRFGGEFRKVPAMFMTPHGLIAHPSLEREIRRALQGGE